MDSESHWQTLYLKEVQRREDAEKKNEEAQRAQQEEQRRREEAEHAVRSTTLAEYLNACHIYLHSSLSLQQDKSLSTQGDASNAKNKVRPRRLLHWDGFPEDQVDVWAKLVKSDFMSERHFPSVTTLRENGESIRRRLMSSELDLHYFERQTVTEPVSHIVERIHGKPELRRKFNIYGSVAFENHSNMLSPEENLSEGLEAMEISEQPSRRRSPRVLEREQRLEQRPTSIASSSAGSGGRRKLPRPRADQFCVYNSHPSDPDVGRRVPVFIIEYKPPHKLTLGQVYEGLGDADLDDVVVVRDTDGVKQKCQRLVVAVISQAFSYMITAGLEFGCVRTGEVSIFLKVPDDPSTVYYFLSVPSGDVGESTGWGSGEADTNRLHLTAVGQMLAFTLQALSTTPRPMSWRVKASDCLPKWEETYEDLLADFPADEAPSSEYRPTRASSFHRASPIQLRSRAQPASPSCRTARHPPNSGTDDDASDPGTPSRNERLPSKVSGHTAKNKASKRPRGGRSKGESQYCTHKCLLGLQKQGAIDLECPNARTHGICHQINEPTFRRLLEDQLRQDVDNNFSPFGRPGARGVAFTVRLARYGYTLVAKCAEFSKHLEHEAAVYNRLWSLQGLHVPVCMGTIRLSQPYWYEGAVSLTHALLLSYAGKPIDHYATANSRSALFDKAKISMCAIHELLVRHKDVRTPNVLFNPSGNQMMIIDFERAAMQPVRPALGAISPNRKRKRDEPATGVHGGSKESRPCESGMQRVELGHLHLERLRSN